MPDLLVRGIDDAVARALKQRAAANGRSVEAEHRDILTSVLVRARKRTFAQVLAGMPDVGRDADFERAGAASEGEARRVFD